MTAGDGPFWRTWRTTPAERSRPLPCDVSMPDAEDVLHRAVDVDAPASVLFRWLCQLKVAPYSYDLLDNRGRRSPRSLSAGADRLALGDRVMTIFTLVDFEPGRQLTIRMTHPVGLRVFGDIAITYLVTPRGAHRSRLMLRMLMRYPPRGAFSAMRAILPFGDWFMAQKQLRVLRGLAERDARRSKEIAA